MRYEQLQHQPRETFRRVCGVSPETFAQMVDALEAAEAGKTKPGRPCELSLADQVLLMLRYHYDYDTQARLGVSYGLSESAVSYLIRRVEARLLSDARFHLPARRARLVHDTPAVVVDATARRTVLTQLGLLERFHQTLKTEEVYRAAIRWQLYDSPAQARESLEASVAATTTSDPIGHRSLPRAVIR